MEENKKKGTSTFYAIIGVATLIVAIIGATFAYFSASATADENSDAITGGTNDVGGSLSLNVTRVLFGTEKKDGDQYDNLVPAIIDATVSGVTKAVTEKCENGGYVGCHLYDIKASSTQTLEAASIKISELSVDAQDKESWKYIVYTNSLSGDNASYETVGSLVTTGAGTFDGFATAYPTGFDMHNGQGLTENVDVHYYLLVYLANKDTTQNVNDGDDNYATDSGVGTYNGKVVMEAANGSVVANFSTTTPIGG